MQNVSNVASVSALTKASGSKWYKNPAYKLNAVSPSLIYDFAKNRYYNSAVNSLPFPFTATRTTNAMQFDSAGQLVWAPANMCVNSTPGASGWTLSGAGTTCSTTGNNTPRGGEEAKLIAGGTLTLNANDGVGGVSLTTNIATAPGNTLVYSFDAKAGEITSIRVREPISTGTRIVVDLTDGTVTAELGSNALTGLLVTATDIGNGWYRIIAKRTVTTTGFDLDLKPGDTTGDGVSGLYIGSVQVELDDATAPKAFVATAGTAYYGPRFDFAPNAGPARGLLIEGPSTNDNQRSNLLTFATFATISTGDAGLGGWVFSRLTADGTSGVHFGAADSITPPALQVRRVQAIIKIITGTRVQLATSGSHGSTNVYVNISGGAIVATGADTRNATIEDCGNGYYLVGFNYTTTAAPTSGASVVVFAIPSDVSGRGAGSTSSDVFDVAFMQNSAGTFATSPVLTTGAAATRGADTFIEATGAWLTQGYGSLYISSILAGIETGEFLALLQIDDGTAGNRVLIQAPTSVTTATIGARIDDTSIIQVNANTGGGSAYFNTMKYVCAYNTNNTRMTRDGGAIVSDVACTMPLGITTLRVGRTTATTVLMRWIKEVRYYPDTSASDAQLQTLTT
jgi:hypothetical protein